MSRPPAAEETIFSAPPARRIGRGTRLNDLYEIDGLVATGGMGEVYRGHAIETGDEVAIKTIKPEFAESGSALALFRKEASALHNLNHEAIIRYYVFSIDKPLGLPYLAMEFVSGDALSDIAARGPLPVEAVDTLRRRLASGLQAAHALGIIHRDVSPDNVILPGGDPARAKIIDFGIARSSLGGATVIGDGFAGKYGYVSPEQLGLHGGEVTPRSDIYSLGLVLAEAALGRRLDMGRNPVDVVEKRRRVPNLAGLDPRLRPLLDAMLQPVPQDRIGTMAEVAAWTSPTGTPKAAFAKSARTTGSARAPADRPSGAPAGRGRRGTILAGSAAAVLAVVAGTAYLGLQAYGPSADSAVDTGLRLEERPAEALPPPQRPDPEPVAVPTQPGSQIPAQPELSAPAVVPPNVSPAPPGPRASTSEGSTMATSTRAMPAAPNAADPSPEPPRATNPAPQREAAAVPPAAPPIAPIEQVANYIRDYRGGDCFYLSPISVGAREASIEAFGAAAPSFSSFDDAFSAALGFDAKIQLRLVAPAQCGVVDVLARQAVQRRVKVPKLALNRDRMRSGEELSGTLDLADDGNAEILLVDDEGDVHNLSRNVRRTGRRLTFSLRLQSPASGARPQLVVAVASTEPLTLLRSGTVPKADDLFRALGEEVSRPGSPLGVAVRYFKLGE